MDEELYDIIVEGDKVTAYPAIISEDLSNGPGYKELKVAWYLSSRSHEVMLKVMELDGLDETAERVEYTYTPRNHDELTKLNEVLKTFGISVDRMEEEVSYILNSNMSDVDEVTHHSFIIGMN